jgi:hypothetical protein
MFFADYHLLEKIGNFDHERIPERVVHARGASAKGFFEASVLPFCYQNLLPDTSLTYLSVLPRCHHCQREAHTPESISSDCMLPRHATKDVMKKQGRKHVCTALCARYPGWREDTGSIGDMRNLK